VVVAGGPACCVAEIHWSRRAGEEVGTAPLTEALAALSGLSVAASLSDHAMVANGASVRRRHPALGVLRLFGMRSGR
jgi:hypothetical protein